MAASLMALVRLRDQDDLSARSAAFCETLGFLNFGKLHDAGNRY
jgi:hypothetical protein